MNTQSINPSNAPYENVLAAWREQRIQALAIPALAQRLSLQERELLPRFAAQYTTLCALPRRTRRALQRQWRRSLSGVALLLRRRGVQ
jgi:hypothetical protein